MNYMKEVPLWMGEVVPGTAQADAAIALPNGGMITRITAYVKTQGSAATHKISVATDASTPVTVCELTVGTNAAKSNLESKTAEASAVQASDTGLTVKSSVSDATADYFAIVWGVIS